MQPEEPADLETETIRVLTYNVRRCLGIDGLLSPARTAAVIAESRPDIIALQELDVRRLRSGGIDQAEQIASELGMANVYFHPALRVLEEEFGDAIITSHPSRLIKAAALPGIEKRPGLEPRGALWAGVEIGGKELQIINTHFGIGRQERKIQAEALMGKEWIGHPDCNPPLIVTGDFNSFPRRRVYRMLASKMRDVQIVAKSGSKPSPTFPSRIPLFRIDHMFVSDEFEVLAAETVRTNASKLASDHLPLLVELRYTPASQP